MREASLEETKIKLPSVRVGLGTLFTVVVTSTSLMGAIFWQLTDKHNLEIFVPRNEYQKDQIYISQTVKEIKEYQSEMRIDIKKILETKEIKK